jgi:hypothetical protein
MTHMKMHWQPGQFAYAGAPIEMSSTIYIQYMDPVKIPQGSDDIMAGPFLTTPRFPGKGYSGLSLFRSSEHKPRSPEQTYAG